MSEGFKLENWKIVRRISGNGASITCICGKVTGNPDFPSGTLITTSRISGYDDAGEAIVVHTINGSVYSLGKPDGAEPFAKRRLLRYLQESASAAEESEAENDNSTSILPTHNPDRS